MKKLITSLLVLGLVLTGVSVGNNVEAATGNSMKTVQQLNKGDKSLENVKIGESMKSVLKSIVILSILITQIVMKSITNLELIKVFASNS